MSRCNLPCSFPTYEEVVEARKKWLAEIAATAVKKKRPWRIA